MHAVKTSLMPSATITAIKLLKALSTARHDGQDWMGPDEKRK